MFVWITMPCGPYLYLCHPVMQVIDQKNALRGRERQRRVQEKSYFWSFHFALQAALEGYTAWTIVRQGSHCERSLQLHSHRLVWAQNSVLILSGFTHFPLSWEIFIFWVFIYFSSNVMWLKQSLGGYASELQLHSTETTTVTIFFLKIFLFV